MKAVCGLWVSTLLIGCGSSQSADDALLASALVTTTPVWVPAVGSTLAYESGVHASQGASIALGIPAQAYSKDINLDELNRIADTAQFHGCKVPYTTNRWEYMGSRGNYHFLSFNDPHSITRKLYRIQKDRYPLNNEFPLTHDRALWRSLDIGTYTDDTIQFIPNIDIFVDGNGLKGLDPNYQAQGNIIFVPAPAPDENPFHHPYDLNH